VPALHASGGALPTAPLLTNVLLCDPACSALVPVLHASDLGTAKGLKKFKEGQKVAGKVLSVDTGALGCCCATRLDCVSLLQGWKGDLPFAIQPAACTLRRHYSCAYARSRTTHIRHQPALPSLQPPRR